MSKLIVAYKIGNALGDLSPKEFIYSFLSHAKLNGDKVLFSSGRFPKATVRDDIENLILISKNGEYGLMADVDYTGVSSLITPPEYYTLPNNYNCEELKEVKKGWFALSNVREIKIEKGEYIITSGKDLLDILDSTFYMFYIEKK